MDEGVQLLELAQSAQRLFERQEPRQKRRLLNFVLSNCSWTEGEMTATFRQPFDLLAETTAIAARQEAVTMANSGKCEIWLAISASHAARGLKPGRVRACISAPAHLSASDCARSSGSRQGWSTYQGVSRKSSMRLPSGSRK